MTRRWQILMAITCCTGLLLTPSSSVMAAPACGPYTVAMYEVGALYYRGDDGQYQGVDPDLVAELARRSGCKLDTVVESRPRIWAQMADGRLDMTMGAQPTAERQHYAEFLRYLSPRPYVVMRQELAAALPTPEAFVADKSRRLMIVRSYDVMPQMQGWLDVLRRQQRLVDAPDQPTALRAFLAGRADALVIGTTSLAMARKRNPAFARIVAQDWAPDDDPQFALAVSRARVSEADRARLRHAMEQMVRDGSVDAIVRRHLGGPLPVPVPSRK